ncbi:MAG: sigma-54 interaction domain-containing protein [Nitrospinaceae bacterium]
MAGKYPLGGGAMERERDSVEYLNTIFDVLNEAVFVYDEEMRIKYFNAAAEKITGHSKEEVIGKKCVTLFDKSVCLNNCALCQTVKQDPVQGKVRFQSPFIRKDGQKRFGEFQAGLLKRDGNGKVEVLVALTDTTEITRLKEKLQKTHSFRNLVGKSHLMKDLFQAIHNISEFDSTVLIQGESGTGKELVARALHYEGPRAREKLITVNCSAFSDNLLESELFGHVKGAFTGAIRDRAGRFEEGNGGTIFLDEIGDLAPRVQVKLLRVIQEKEIQRVGENTTRKVNIRIIAATNTDLSQEVREGRFREDLYYRLNVIPIQLPPLRLRTEDIPHLVRHFIENWNGVQKKTISGISEAALGRLMDYDWPGNVRELENAIEHACVKGTREIIGVEDLPASIFRPRKFRKTKRSPATRERVLKALAETGNNQTRAARLLEMHRITLWRKMKTFKINV